MSLQSLNAQCRVMQAHNLVGTTLDDAKVMMSIDTGKYYSLKGIAGHIWEILETPHSVDDILPTMQQEYAVDAEICRADLLVFFQAMVSERLLVIV